MLHYKVYITVVDLKLGSI